MNEKDTTDGASKESEVVCSTIKASVKAAKEALVANNLEPEPVAVAILAAELNRLYQQRIAGETFNRMSFVPIPPLMRYDIE